MTARIFWISDGGLRVAGTTTSKTMWTPVKSFVPASVRVPRKSFWLLQKFSIHIWLAFLCAESIIDRWLTVSASNLYIGIPVSETSVFYWLIL